MPGKALITSVANQKGGVGKTTTCENLGVGLARAGNRVLLVDTDPQASLTVSLGFPQPDQLTVTLSELLTKVMEDRPLTPGEGILHHKEGVDLLPANITLAGTEVSLVNAMSREKILKQYLDTVKKDYDYILLDCMPSLGMLTVNALAASDQVLIPVHRRGMPADLIPTPGYIPDRSKSAIKEAVDSWLAEHRPEFSDGVPYAVKDALLTLFEQLRPPVCFLDVDMPGMTGIDCAKLILDMEPRTMLIFATAHDDYMAQAFELYAFDYIVKPFDEELLKETIEKHTT